MQLVVKTGSRPALHERRPYSIPKYVTSEINVRPTTLLFNTLRDARALHATGIHGIRMGRK